MPFFNFKGTLYLGIVKKYQRSILIQRGSKIASNVIGVLICNWVNLLPIEKYVLVVCVFRNWSISCPDLLFSWYIFEIGIQILGGGGGGPNPNNQIWSLQWRWGQLLLDVKSWGEVPPTSSPLQQVFAYNPEICPFPKSSLVVGV